LKLMTDLRNYFFILLVYVSDRYWILMPWSWCHQHIWLPTSMLSILSVFYLQNIIQVSFYANVLALCIALITIGALVWSSYGSKSHAAYKPANGHTRTRIRKSCLFMIIFLSFISSFAISVIVLSYSFNL